MMFIISVYAPQTGRTQEDKDAFRSNLEEIIRQVEPETVLVVAGDMKAHVGKRKNCEETIGSMDGAKETERDKTWWRCSPKTCWWW